MNKYVSIDFDKCRPDDCHREQGFCSAAKSCPRNLLEQEDLIDPPMLISDSLCVACGDCLRACPYSVLSIVRG